MNPTSINKWIGDGRLSAFRTPGGHRRIRAADLVAFLTAHQMPVPDRLAPAALRRLLVVDDDEKLLEGFRRMMRPYEHRVVVSTAANGIDALVMVGALKPQLVLLDVFMPEVDGFEVCRRLAANPETADINILLCTGSPSEEVDREARRVGARCLPKPVGVEVVLDVLGVTGATEALRAGMV